MFVGRLMSSISKSLPSGSQLRYKSLTAECFGMAFSCSRDFAVSSTDFILRHDIFFFFCRAKTARQLCPASYSLALYSSHTVAPASTSQTPIMPQRIFHA